MWLLYWPEEIYLIAVLVIPFLGFLSDSSKQSFLLPEDKKLKFSAFRDSLIESKVISAKSLQRFAGKIVSFSLAVPAAKLFCREVNFSIRKALKNSNPLKCLMILRKSSNTGNFFISGMASYHGERRVTLSLRSSLMPQTQAGVAFLPCLGHPRKQETIGPRMT